MSAGSEGEAAESPKEKEKEKSAFVVFEDVSRVYKKAAADVVVFDKLSFTIQRGEFVAMLGPSGSGKTTILNLLAGFDSPTSGKIKVGEDTISGLSEDALADWRGRNLGFVFQSNNLISLLTAMENVEFPLRRLGMARRERRARAEKALSLVGLAKRAQHFPRELSTGEEQRVAIARAIVTDPRFLIADEPTGNLDAVSAKQINEIFQLLNREHEKTILLATHDQNAASYAQRRLHLRKGVLVDDEVAAQ